jgi:hypothetical protein
MNAELLVFFRKLCSQGDGVAAGSEEVSQWMPEALISLMLAFGCIAACFHSSVAPARTAGHGSKKEAATGELDEQQQTTPRAMHIMFAVCHCCPYSSL